MQINGTQHAPLLSGVCIEQSFIEKLIAFRAHNFALDLCGGGGGGTECECGGRVEWWECMYRTGRPDLTCNGNGIRWQFDLVQVEWSVGERQLF